MRLWISLAVAALVGILAGAAVGQPADAMAGFPTPAGVVKSSAGEPVPGVNVLLITAGDSALNNNTWIRGGEMLNAVRDNKQVDKEAMKGKTDDAGFFSFENPLKGYVLFFSHETGWNEVTPEELAAGSEVVLRPWSAVKGRLYIAGKPAPGRRAILTRREGFDNLGRRTSERGWFQVNHQIEMVANEEGDFLSSRVVPGDYSEGEISAVVHTGFPDGIRIASARSPLPVGEGETVHVEPGRAMQKVRAQFKLEAEKADWSRLEIHVFPAGAFKEVPEGGGECGLPYVQSGGYLKFFETADSAPYRVGKRGADDEGVVTLGPLPGENWEMHAFLRVATDGRDQAEAALGVRKRFVIDPRLDGKDPEELDLGVIELAPVVISEQLRKFLDKWTPAENSASVLSGDERK